MQRKTFDDVQAPSLSVNSDEGEIDLDEEYSTPERTEDRSECGLGPRSPHARKPKLQACARGSRCHRLVGRRWHRRQHS